MTRYIVVSENEIVKAEMERPHYSHYFHGGKAEKYKLSMKRFESHIASLPRIPIKGKHKWEVWQEVEEGKDFTWTKCSCKIGSDCPTIKGKWLSPCYVAIPIQPTPEGEKPKIVCYCGSLRVAMDAFKKAEYDAVIKGEIALLPCCMFVDIQREYGAESDYKQKADEVHKRKIDICDEVFVLNIDGYIGESTRSEIQYAEKIGKPVKYLEPTHQR